MKSSEADGLDLFKFKGAVIELCLGEGHELPTEKDITMVSPDVAGSFVHRVSFCVCCYLLCSAPFSLTPPPNRSIVRLTSIPWNAQAFETADMDKSGLVDEEEFLELYSHVKDGNVKGLAGGYFSKKKKIVVSVSTVVHIICVTRLPKTNWTGITQTKDTKSIMPESVAECVGPPNRTAKHESTTFQ